MPQIPIEEAYSTACQKLGEVTVRESLLYDVLAQKDAEIAALKEQLVNAGVIEEATEIVEGADVTMLQEVNQGKAIGSNGANSNGSSGGEAVDQDQQPG